MHQKSMSLYDLLKPNLQQATKIKKEMPRIQKILKSEIPELKWNRVEQDIYQQLDKLLDVSLGSVFANVWTASQQVKQIIEKQNQEMTGDISVIPLPTHKIKSKHEPKLKIMLNDEQVGIFRLTAIFGFKLSNILLKIQYGKIQTVLSGTCKGVGSLSYHDTQLLENQIPEFDLPTHINVIKTHKEQIETERDSADDIMTENRKVDNYDIKIQSQKVQLSSEPIGLGKKLTLLTIGVFIAFLLIIAIMLLL